MVVLSIFEPVLVLASKLVLTYFYVEPFELLYDILAPVDCSHQLCCGLKKKLCLELTSRAEKCFYWSLVLKSYPKPAQILKGDFQPCGLF